MSSRIIWVNRSIREDLEAAGQGFIYAFWHGRQVFLAYLHQGDRIHPLVSRSADGEIIAEVCRSFGLEAVRGSTSKGASEALLKLKDLIRAGERVGLTPDGPRGPFHEVQLGVLYLSQVTGAPIVPVAFGARKKWIFKGWDEFIVPKPFNRITMIYGEPMRVAKEDNLDKKAGDLKRALDQVTQDADNLSQGACQDEPPAAPESFPA